MNTTDNFNLTIAPIDAGERTFVTNEIRDCLNFIRSARMPADGWGLYPGMTPDLHSTSLAMQALQAFRDPNSAWLIADVHIRTRIKIDQGLKEYSLDQLVDAANIICAQDNPDESDFVNIRKALSSALNLHSTEFTWTSVRSFARALQAITLLHPGSDPNIAVWVQKLASCQLSSDGGWSSAATEPGSIVNTSIAIQALLPFVDMPGIQESILRGRNFLISQIDELGWNRLGGGDVFVITNALNAVTLVSADNEGRIQEGVDALLSLHNDSGGWGGGNGEPSNVEASSLAIIALLKAREDRFIPSRLARATIRGLDESLQSIAREFNQLKQDFEQQVSLQCGKVGEELERLRNENKKLNSIASTNSEQLAQIIERRMQLRDWRLATSEIAQPESRIESLRDTILGVTLGMLVVVVFRSILVGDGYRPVPIICALIAVPIATFWAYSYFRRSKRRSPAIQTSREYALRVTTDEQSISMSLARLRDQFFLISDDWPTSVREEVVYRLNEDVVDLPSDIGRRYLFDLIDQLAVPQKSTRLLLPWFNEVIDLSPTTRRVLFNQIRRLILR